MKKYAAAGAAAVMVFGITAFAASFEVNESALATGLGDVTACGDVTVLDYDVNTSAGTVSAVTIALAAADNAGCEGATIVGTFFDGQDGSGAVVAETAPGTIDDQVTLAFNDDIAVGPIESVRFNVFTSNS